MTWPRVFVLCCLLQLCQAIPVLRGSKSRFLEAETQSGCHTKQGADVCGTCVGNKAYRFNKPNAQCHWCIKPKAEKTCTSNPGTDCTSGSVDSTVGCEEIAAHKQRETAWIAARDAAIDSKLQDVTGLNHNVLYGVAKSHHVLTGDTKWTTMVNIDKTTKPGQRKKSNPEATIGDLYTKANTGPSGIPTIGDDFYAFHGTNKFEAWEGVLGGAAVKCSGGTQWGRGLYLAIDSDIPTNYALPQMNARGQGQDAGVFYGYLVVVKVPADCKFFVDGDAAEKAVDPKYIVIRPEADAEPFTCKCVIEPKALILLPQPVPLKGQLGEWCTSHGC